MKFPAKFKQIVQLRHETANLPDYGFLTLVACVLSEDACGWVGWQIDGAFKRKPEGAPLEEWDLNLPANDEQVCPKCGKPTYRLFESVTVVRTDERINPFGNREPTPYEIGEDEFI